MNRYPNLVVRERLAGPLAGLFATHRHFPKVGTFAVTLPDWLPRTEKGLVLVHAGVIGGGCGACDYAVTAQNRGGSGAGCAVRTFEVPPGSEASIVVPAGGAINAAIAGGTASLTLGGVTLQATGGQDYNHPGVGSGGDINTAGGNGGSAGLTSSVQCGGSAGSPWENGRPGASAATPGPKWRRPSIVSLDDLAADSAYWLELTGFGQGGGSGDGGGTPSFGGGGGVGAGPAAQAGAQGFAWLFF